MEESKEKGSNSGEKSTFASQRCLSASNTPCFPWPLVKMESLLSLGKTHPSERRRVSPSKNRHVGVVRWVTVKVVPAFLARKENGG